MKTRCLKRPMSRRLPRPTAPATPTPPMRAPPYARADDSPSTTSSARPATMILTNPRRSLVSPGLTLTSTTTTSPPSTPSLPTTATTPQPPPRKRRRLYVSDVHPDCGCRGEHSIFCHNNNAYSALPVRPPLPAALYPDTDIRIASLRTSMNKILTLTELWQQPLNDNENDDPVA